MKLKIFSLDFTKILTVVVFVVFNYMTLDYFLPWIDECMFLDTPINLILTGEWKTTCWYAGGDQEPFSTYPPLYQMLESIWMYIFGYTALAARFLNIVFMMLLTWLLFKILDLLEFKMGVVSSILLLCLLWGDDVMSWTYRNARPDLLGALISSIIIFQIVRLLKREGSCFYLFMSSLFLALSGYQACVFMLFSSIFLYIVFKNRRKDILKYSFVFVGGVVAGVAVTALFMALHGRLFAYFVSIVSYSATLNSLAAILLPYIGPLVGLDSAHWIAKLDNDSQVSLIDKFLSMFDNIPFVILIILSLCLFIISLRNRDKAINWKSEKGFLCIAFAIYIPIVMNLAGRFVLYYQWMAIIPIIIGIALMFDDCKYLLAKVCVVVVSLCLTTYGLSNKLEHEKRDKVMAFLNTCDIKEGDIVYMPFNAFFEGHNKGVKCYFPVYPTEMMPLPNYIITYFDDSEETRIMKQYLVEISNNNNAVKVAEDKIIGMAIYKIMRNE